MKAFPPHYEEPGHFAVELDSQERGKENPLRVAIVAGKLMFTDGVSLYRLGNTLADYLPWYTTFNGI